ncbi:MAG: MFS transporter, partial [Microbacterium sp.]
MPLSPWRLRLLIVSLLTVSFLGALDHTVVATSLATITGELGAVEQMSWVIVSYTLASTVLLPVLGKLADLVGPRLIFFASVVVFLVASLFCGFAQDITQLAIARVAQGAGSAGLMLMPQTIIGEVISPRQRPRVLSIIGVAFPIAILVGPLIGGVITDAWGWRWVFWVNIPLGLVALALAVIAVPHIEGRSGRRFDVAGAVVLGVAVTAFVFAVGSATAGDAENAMPVLITALLAVVATAAFIAIELRVAEPLVPLRHFADRTIVVCIVLSTVIGVGLFSVVAYVPTYIQMAYRTSATVSGLVPIATVFGMLISTLLTGWLASRSGRYRIFPVLGTAVAAVGLFVMSLLPPGMPLWVPMLAMGLVGIGTGAFMNIIIAVAQSAAPRTDTGSVTATISLVRQIGSTAATAIVGGLIGVGVTAGLPASLDAATLTPQAVSDASAEVQTQVAELYSSVLAPIFVGLALAYVVGIVAALLLPNGRLTDDREPPPVSAAEAAADAAAASAPESVL